MQKINNYTFIYQAPVVQKLDTGAIHRINHYLTDRCQGKQLRYPVDIELSSGQRYQPFEQLGPGVWKKKYLRKYEDIHQLSKNCVKYVFSVLSQNQLKINIVWLNPTKLPCFISYHLFVLVVFLRSTLTEERNEYALKGQVIPGFLSKSCKGPH